jgi:ferrous iron transport protein A
MSGVLQEAPGGVGEARLSQLPAGTLAVVRRVLSDPDAARRLMELGLVPGTPVELVRRAPMGDPLELRVRGAHFSIRRSEADRIHVDPV